jgi:hypothetical protein
MAISKAINWFFEQVTEGIILEDDCLADQSFFHFAEQMLEKYKDDESIIAINGCNFGFEYHDASYFFSRYMNVWGWATWRRVVLKISYEIPDWEKLNKISFLRSRLKRQMIDLDLPWFKYWKETFDMISSGRLDTWDFFWIYHQLVFKKKSIISSVNLVTNIGFDARATHTTLLSHPASNLLFSEMQFPLVHPKRNVVNKQYEEDILKPICYMFKSKPNSFYIKNMLLKIPYLESLSKRLFKK